MGEQLPQFSQSMAMEYEVVTVVVTVVDRSDHRRVQVCVPPVWTLRQESQLLVPAGFVVMEKPQVGHTQLTDSRVGGGGGAQAQDTEQEIDSETWTPEQLAAPHWPVPAVQLRVLVRVPVFVPQSLDAQVAEQAP